MSSKNNTYYYIIRKLSEYLIALCMILDCRSIWLNEYEKIGRNRNILVLLLAVAMLLYLFSLRSVRKSAARKAIIYTALFVVYSLFFLLLRTYNTQALLRTVLAFMFIIFIMKLAPDISYILSILRKYINLITIIALVSIVIWLLGPVLGILHTNCSFVETWNWTAEPQTVHGYFGIHYEIPLQVFKFAGHSIYKNTSFFVEAPMASFAFSIGLLSEVFFFENRRVFNVLILLLGILSTGSTTGLIVSVASIFYMLLVSKFHDKFIQILKFIIVPVLVIAGIILVVNRMKLKFDISYTNSGMVRLDDIIAGIKCWEKNPFLGYGYGNNDVIIPYMSSFRSYNKGLSNSLIQLLVNGGVYYVSLFVGFVIVGLRNLIKNKYYKELLSFLIYLAIYIFTIVTYQYISAFVFAMYANYLRTDHSKKQV